MAQIETISFPQSTGYSLDYLKANFWRLNYSSAGPALAYRIVVPVKMRPTNVKPTTVRDIGITLIGEYQIIDKTMPYLEVQVAYEKVSNVHPDIKSWFNEKLKKLKGTLRAKAAINIAGKNGYDVLFTRTLKSGEQYITRASMLVAGDNYVMVTAMSSKADYDKSAKTIYHILSNWNMQ
ncbi:hypothetical protein GCM10011425_10990 [Mucilaginibacter galii]|uniref:Uncharacterized protein n=1 Tax=Mucilaginibacter galii TaxID=2005073 RepID=A0A917J855_9SPHI|nr:hypothetical protein [Mucilaginibacter galii]GGI49887.1 hypothetical protein GCM10011425_10990 [Mucilaginibacter galii]